MCRYCNFDVYTHYLVNGELSLEDTFDIGTQLEDLTFTEISATEDIISTYKLEDDITSSTLQGKKKYSASFIDGEELPDWINLDSNTGQFTVQPEYTSIGTHEIIAQVTDEFGESVNSLVLLEVSGKDGQKSLLEEDINISINDDSKLNNINLVGTQEATTQPQISINDVQTTDSSAGRELTFTIKLTFTISLSTTSTETITVEYATTDNTAVEGEDYFGVNNTVTFAPGETSKTITVNTTGTSYLDEDESFLVNLSNPTNAIIGDGQGEGTIIPAYGGIRGWQRSQETVTFSFFDEDVFGQGGYDGSTRESNAREASEVVKASYRQIFDHLNTFVDREFVEVAESESTVGNIRIVVSDAPDYAYAGGHIHLAGWAAASDSGINGFESVPGVYGYSTLLHELGHALGMPHSFGSNKSVFDPEENSSNTVMSYTFPGNHPGTFMAYDIKSLQERYGADEYREGDTVYEFLTVDNYTVNGELAVDTSSRLKQTIWDSDGTDTFDFSNLAFDNSGYRFDLNQSKYQTTQNAYQGSSYTRNGTKYYVPKYGTSTAIDVEIENLINSSSDDIIIANPAANWFSGYSPELATGSDRIIDTNNLDTLDLSTFAFSKLSLVQINEDLEIDLGDSNFINLEGYYSLAENDRINILYKPENTEIVPTPPVVSIEDLTVYETDSNRNAVVTLSLDKAIREEFIVSYNTQDNTAIAGEDYQAVNGMITFNPGEISKIVNIPIVGDSLIESNESFYLTTGYGNAEILIDDDDLDILPQINIQDTGVLSSIPVRDGNGNIKNTTGLLFKITLDAPSNQTIKVDYATADGTAIAGEDYRAKNKTFTFNPGETEKQVFVGVTVDDTEEVDENLYLNLSNPVNAIIADNQATGTIEETRSLSVSELEVREDGTEALFTISLDKPSVQGVFVNYSTADGTAQAGTDYTKTSGRLFIKAGEARATIAVPLINNNITEIDETFFLNLTKPKYVLVEDSQGQATIINDDVIPTENPGGVYQDLQFWLKADAGITINNGTVSGWNDSSQGSNDLTEIFGGTNPNLNSNGINFNPTVEFDDTSDRLGSSSINNFPTTEITQFLVFQRENPNRNEAYFSYANSQSNEFVLFNSGNETEVIINNSSRRVNFSVGDRPVILGVDWQSETGAGNVYANGNGFEFVGSTSPITASGTIVLGEEQDSRGGGFSTSQAFLGQIAENIIFDRVLTSIERQRVESYLGIKYGTTLDQTTPTNYVTSDGSIIWNATAAGNYNQDVTGIAIDNASDLNQTKSRSSSDDGIVIVSNASDLDNGEALIWSNDGGAINAESVSLTNGTYYLSRQWQVQETGNVGTVDFSFDLTGLGYSTDDNINEFALLIDDDEDFSNATSINTGLQVNGNQISFSNLDLQDGQYFTLAVPEKRSPGGIKSNLQLWLRGDDIVTDNNSVTQWRDLSGKGLDYIPNDVDNQPVLATEEFNFNPAVSFDGNDLLTTTRTNFTQGEVFFVLKGQDNGGSSSLLGDLRYTDSSNFKYEQWWNKGKLGFSRRWVGDYTSNINSPNNQLSLVSFNSDTDSSIINLAIENNGILSQDSVDIAASNPISIAYLAEGFKGEIAEVIVFDAVLSNTEKLQLRSNLAIKYGLNLDLNADYVNSDNQIWWNSDLAGDYNNDVAGIAKDDSSDLAQVKSRSSNANSIVTIAAENTVNGLEDGEALIWGNNNSAELIQRIWQVQESQGDVGKVSISFDLSNLGEQFSTEDYALQISNDDSFNNYQFHTFGRTIDGDTLTFTGVDFKDGEYFTLNNQYSNQVSSINGTESNNFLIGTVDAETINGYEGNDRLRGGNGNDTIDGGDGRDILLEASQGDFLLTNDLLTNNIRGTDSFSNIEVVILHGHEDDNLIDGSAANTLKGMFYGHDGNDTLIGGNANDVLKGGEGNDFIYGKGGANVVFGNNGADTFALEPNSGKVLIKDFNNDVDFLGLSSSLEFDDLKIVENAAGTATFIKNMNNNAVLAVIQNVNASDLTRDDFTSI